ncbi:MAG: diguanylate cyclase [Sulfuritalea sp.]|nr:diguanylate cyclase [Sulfuritalea sp.]
MTDPARQYRRVVNGRYRIRMLAFALACVPIGLHIWPRGYGLGIWALFVVQFLIYPHLLYWRSRTAKDPKRSEASNVIIDSVALGAWAAGLGFPLWISVGLFLTILVNHALTGGLQGILLGLMAFASGALASTALVAFHVSTDTDGLVTLFSIIALAVYLSLIGIESFRYAQQLHQVQSTLDRQKMTLEEANAALHNQIQKIDDLREKLREQANRDSLTGLFNRRYLEGTLERERARCRREGAPLTMLMIDVDHFKMVNDDYGHQAGDEVLRVLGKLLLENARTEDIVCRYGGEEFLLVLPKMPLDIALDRAAQLLKFVQETSVSYGEMRIRTTVSIGVATTPAHADSAEALLKCADKALYQAKARGRNRVVAYGDPASSDHEH